MSLKSNYKDEIPSGGYPTYNIVGSDGTVIQSDVKIVRSNGNEQDGDAFGAYDVNLIMQVLNKMYELIDIISLYDSSSALTLRNELKTLTNNAESEEN